ncbi:MAG: autotransporter domain-containing protein [Porticoccaceae bacterium]
MITIDDSVGRADVVLQSDDYAEARAQGIDVHGDYGDLFIENSKGYGNVDLTLLADGDDHQGRLYAYADGVDLTSLDYADVREVYGLAEVELSFGDATAGTVYGDVDGVDVSAEMAVLESVEGVSRATITGGASGEDVTGTDLEASLSLRAVDVDAEDIDMTGVTGRAYGDITLGGETTDADISVNVNAWGIDAGSEGLVVGEQLAATNVAGYVDIDIDLTSTAAGEAGGSVYSEVNAIATDLNDDGGLDSLVVVENVAGEALISTVGAADDDVRLRASAEGVELIGDLGVTGSGVDGHVDIDLDATAGVDGYASVRATAVDIQTELELGDVIDVADITALADISATAVGGAISDAQAYSVGLYVEGQAVELETVDATASAAASAGSVDNDSEISATARAIGGEIIVAGDSSITAASFSADADAAAAYGFDLAEFKYSFDNTVTADARALVADVDGRDSDLQLTDIDVEVDASGSMTNGRLLSGEALNFFVDGVDVDAVGIDLASKYNEQGLTAEVGELVLAGVSVSSQAVSASVEGVYNEGLFGVVGEAYGYAVIDSHLADAAAFGVRVQGSVATDDSGVELEFDALDVTMSDIDVYLAEVSSSVVTSLDGEGAAININRVSAEYMGGNGLARTSAYGVNIDAVFSNEPTEEQKYSSDFFFGYGDDGEVGDVSLTDVSVTLADVHARAEGVNVLALVEKYGSAGSITENDLLFAEAWGVAAYSEFGDISANGLDVAINAGAHAEGLSLVIGEADGANWDSNDIAELTVAGVQLEVINDGDITLEQSSVELTTSAAVDGYAFIDLRAPTDQYGYADGDIINTETYGVILDGSGESRVDALTVDIASTSTVSGIVSTGESSSGLDFLLGALDSTLGGLSGITAEGTFVDSAGEIIESEVRGLHAVNSDSLVVDDATIDIEVANELSASTSEGGVIFGYSEGDISYTVAISAGDTIQSDVVGVYAEANELLELTDLQVTINSSNIVGTDTDKYTLAYVAAGDDIIDSDIKGIDAYSNPSDISLRDFSVAIDDAALVQLAQGRTESDAAIQMRATGVDTYTEEGMISIVDVANDGIARADDEWSVDISLAATVNSNRTVEGEAEPVAGFIYAGDDLIDVEIEGIDAYVEESGGDIQLGGGEAGEFLAVKIDLAGQLTGNMGTDDDAIDFDNIEGIYAYSENGYLFAENVTVDANFDAHIYGEVQAGDNGVYFDIDGFDLNAEDGLVLENVTSDLVIDTIIDGEVYTSSEMVHLQTVQNDADSDSAHVYATNISTNIDISVLGEGHLQADSDMVYAENITGLEVYANDYIYIANLTSSVNLDVDLLGEGSADADLVDISSVHSAYFDSSGSSVEIQQADIDLTIDVNIESAAVDGLAAGDNAVEISSVTGLSAGGNNFTMADFDVYVDISATADQDDAQITATALGLDLRGVGGSGDYGELVDLSRGDIAISTAVTTGGLLGGESGEVAYAESVGVWLYGSNLMLEDVTIEAYAGAESLNPAGDARAESYGLWVTSATYVGLDISADEKITSSAVASGEASIAYANAVYVEGDYLNVDNAGVISANADASDYGEATAVAMNLQIDDGSFAYVEQSDIVAADAFTLENSGEISAHVSAGGDATGIEMNFYGLDSTNVVINNREGGVISATADDSYGVAIAISTDSDVLITNDGTITGAVRTGYGDDSFFNNSMNTWNAYGESDFGIGEDSIINAETGRIVMTDALIDLGLAGEDGNVFDNQGLIEIVGDNLIDMGKYFESDNPNALENSGHIDFTDDDGDTDDSLMIYGDFSSDGGQISVDIDGAEGASDMLMISGDLEGTTLLNAIIHSVPHNVEEFAVQVVDVEGEQIGDISIGEVTFADDHLFDYNVVREWASDSSEQGWLDVSIESLSSAGVTLTSVAPALQSMWHQSVGTLAQRDGVQRSDNGTVGLWARGFASSGDIEVSNNYETLSGFELDVDGSELGIDFAVGENVKLGLFAGSSSAEFDINSGIGQGDFDGDFVGAFIQYRSDSFVADFSYRDMDIDGHVLSGAVTEKVKGEIDGYNIELGYTFALESGLKIQPQLQLSEANLSLNNLADVETTYGYFTQAEGDSLQSRVGVMFSRDYVSGDDSWTPYLTVSSIDESDATNDYEINGLQGISDAGGNSFALEIGINGTVGEAVFYGGLDYLDGGANDAILGAKAGIKFSF